MVRGGLARASGKERESRTLSPRAKKVYESLVSIQKKYNQAFEKVSKGSITRMPRGG
jgi:hypothetical protein